MKKIILSSILIFISIITFAQNKKENEIQMISNSYSENPEIRDILQFEGINYLKLSFSNKNLKGKGYHLTVKEIWDGLIKTDTTIINSSKIPFEQFQKINDTVLNIKIISKLNNRNKLKMTFKLPNFSITKEYEAIESDDYSLRNIAEVTKEKIEFGKKFYLLAYILPYEKDGSKYWCAVESSGKNIENWGKEFGIKHYLVFEMKFE